MIRSKSFKALRTPDSPRPKDVDFLRPSSARMASAQPIIGREGDGYNTRKGKKSTVCSRL